MAREIRLPRGLVALVDDEDYGWLSRWSWSYDGRYAKRVFVDESGARRTVSMHRLVMGEPEGLCVLHFNGDLLDNRRSNLRVCAMAEVSRRRRMQANNTSGYRGVRWVERIGRWKARIRVCGRRIELGDYRELMDAVRAYDEASVRYHGEYGRRNLGDFVSGPG